MRLVALAALAAVVPPPDIISVGPFGSAASAWKRSCSTWPASCGKVKGKLSLASMTLPLVVLHAMMPAQRSGAGFRWSAGRWVEARNETPRSVVLANRSMTK